MAILMLGYVRYDPYQIDGDAVSYMDIASAMLHGRWHDVVNGWQRPVGHSYWMPLTQTASRDSTP